MTGLELVRWAVYADLGLLFGVPAAAIVLRSKQTFETVHRGLSVLAIAALPLTASGFLLLVAQMAGTGIAGVDPGLISQLLTGSALGQAAIVRSIALLGAVAVLVWPSSDLRWLVLPAAIALASLAWSGHAAASEGWVSALRLTLDVVHLSAASIWIGALAVFLVKVLGGSNTTGDLAMTLARFAGIGSALVGTLLATGVVNLLFLVVPKALPALVNVTYGRLMLLKLCAFLGMLALAATNRFVLVPGLMTGGTAADRAATLRKLKFSIIMETALGFAVLLVVAQLGLEDPSVQ